MFYERSLREVFKKFFDSHNQAENINGFKKPPVKSNICGR